MGAKQRFNQLIVELDKTNQSDESISSYIRQATFLAEFMTATDGRQVYFTPESRKCINALAKSIYQNDKEIAKVIKLPQFELMVRQGAGNLYAEGKLIPDCGYGTLKEAVKTLVKDSAKNFTHHFPAWTIGLEKEQPLAIGPVTILTVNQWIESVDFPDFLKDTYPGVKADNYNWQELLKNTLQDSGGEKPAGLASLILPVVSKSNAVLKVSISGVERTYSRKLAEVVCKGALDIISLSLGRFSLFNEQALTSERLISTSEHYLIETDGKLWPPGKSMTDRVSHTSIKEAMKVLKQNRTFMDASGKILGALIESESHEYPELSKRWLTSLNWLAEGCREKNDAIAVTKIATSLDVLATASNDRRISEMLENLLGIKKDDKIVKGSSPRTLKELVEQIYNKGRSQILHGKHYDVLLDFEEQRRLASQLARRALIEAAVRLDEFAGVENDKTFRTIPAVATDRT